MAIGIRLHLARLSLSNTAIKIYKFGVGRSRKAVHDWVQKADLQPASEANPDHIVLDETAIRINGHQCWLYTAVDPATNRFLHIRLFTTTITALPHQNLHELTQKHGVGDIVFLDDHAQHLETALQRAGLRFQPIRHGHRNSIEHIFKKVKQRTSSFGNSFSHIDTEIAETWLQAFAVWWNTTN